MSLQDLSNYVIYSKYAHFLPDLGRRETWEEIVDRVFGMHAFKYRKQLNESVEFSAMFEKSKQAVKDKKVLGSQRALQFGGGNILRKNLKIYNCVSTIIDRSRSFQEIGYLLLCGCGVGYSVQYHHIENLPKIRKISEETVTYTPEDSIEGWSECWGILINSYFQGNLYQEYSGKKVVFDLSNIRPAGSLIAKQFKAPGPEPLRKSLDKIRKIFDNAIASEQEKLTPLQVHDIICIIADSVISGGVRRSALISLFSKEDREMSECKTGNWFINSPHRARANNSVVLKRGQTTHEEFSKIFGNVKEFGEPGFYFVEDNSIHATTNPCVEIGFYPVLPDGQSGFCGCNLTEINGAACKTVEEFLEAAQYAAFIGTMQAGYTDMPYLGDVSKQIFEKEALLGVSITGWMDNPDILFNKDNLLKGVEIVKETNVKFAKIIGINPAARLTCTKPSGSASSLLSTGSGIHPQHSKKYLRRVQVNKQEFSGKWMKKNNPISVQESVWSTNKTDNVISFPCRVADGALVKKSLTAIEFLEKIKFAQKYWVNPGTNPELGLSPDVTHNISCTVNVSQNEWDMVRDYIYENRYYFSGVSLLSGSGDLDYDQAPFVEVLDPEELVKKYGNGVPLASGLIVDALHAFGNLWKACDSVLGIGEILENINEPEEPRKPRKVKSMSEKQYSNELANYAIELNLFYQEKGKYEILNLKLEWVRRAKQFAQRYFDGDIKKMTYCLKHVSIWKDWLDINREWKSIDWGSVKESEIELIEVGSLSAQACAGGRCETT